MENKVLVFINVPRLERKFEIFLPVSKTIGETILLISKVLVELSNGHYVYQNEEKLYSKITGKEYDLYKLVIDTDIRNGSELIFI